MDDAGRNKLASGTVRVVLKVFPRANVRFSSEWRVRVVCCGAEMAPKFPRHFEDHQERKRVQRDQFSSPFLRVVFGRVLFFSLYSLPRSSPFITVTHALAFLTQYRSCTLSRKSKASGVDLPTSSARRRKSTWGKEPGNSPRLNSNR